MSEQTNMSTRYEREIPEGYEARIEGNKVIFELKDDEKIRKAIGYAICVAAHEDGTLINNVTEDEALAYLEKQKEQKLTKWSEEDKVMLNNIIRSVHMKSIMPLDEMDDRSKYKKYENFLNSLPERFNLQPKQEWGKEDEKMLNGIIERGNSEIPKGECGLTPNQVAWLETRLKSLRPQPHWKPSVEQMADLDFSARLIGATCHNLKSLYYDLKEQYSL